MDEHIHVQVRVGAEVRPQKVKNTSVSFFVAPVDVNAHLLAFLVYSQTATKKKEFVYAACLARRPLQIRTFKMTGP